MTLTKALLYGCCAGVNKHGALAARVGARHRGRALLLRSNGVGRAEVRSASTPPCADLPPAARSPQHAAQSTGRVRRVGCAGRWPERMRRGEPWPMSASAARRLHGCRRSYTYQVLTAQQGQRGSMPGRPQPRRWPAPRACRCSPLRPPSGSQRRRPVRSRSRGASPSGRSCL